MRSPIRATYAAALTSFARATSKGKNAALLLVSVAVLLAGGVVTVRAQSALDGFDPNTNGPVSIVVMQPDGKILIGGVFPSVLDAAPPTPTPTPTPGAARIAFASNPQTFESSNEIFVMDSNGANQTQLTFHGSTLSDSSRPSWSPDGTKIVFQKRVFFPPNFLPNSYIYIMNAERRGSKSL